MSALTNSRAAYIAKLEADRDELRSALTELADDFLAYAGRDAPMSGYYQIARRLLDSQRRREASDV